MHRDEIVETHGRFRHVAVEKGALLITGWAASVGGAPVDDFRVWCAGREFRERHVTTGLHSPGVQVFHPGLEDSEGGRYAVPVPLRRRGHCGFQIRAPLTPAEQRRVRSSAVGVVPVCGGREGGVMVWIMDPALPLPPSEAADSVGSSYSFTKVARDFLGYFVQRAGLRRSDRVLDVGCGVGRMAYSLAHYLTAKARYEGFDIVDSSIRWCQQEITPRFPHFHFRTVELYNKMYHPGGTRSALDFVFPYEDEQFDFVFLTSIFTHMRPDEVRHYLEEIGRVLKPGGRCLCTLFLLNEESRRLIRAGKSTQNMIHPLGECFTTEPDLPEAAVGFEEAHVLEWIAERRFTIAAKCYGSWCGRLRFTSYQDMLIWFK
jgi:ubiquinone/menaquinone biosynthesis C-methylase UbiE